MNETLEEVKVERDQAMLVVEDLRRRLENFQEFRLRHASLCRKLEEVRYTLEDVAQELKELAR